MGFFNSRCGCVRKRVVKEGMEDVVVMREGVVW